MKAFLIEIEPMFGQRAGDINIKKHYCPGWNNRDLTHEIRIAPDGVDASDYEGIDGITFLDGIDAIQSAIDNELGGKDTMMTAAEFDKRKKRAAKMKADGKIIGKRIKERKAKEKAAKEKEKNHE